MTQRQLRPPPDLHALIREHGAYSKIPPAAWAEYDRAMEQWKDDLRNDRLLIDDTTQPTGASARGAAIESAENRNRKMDMTDYAGSSWLKLEDVREPRRAIITDCVKGNYERPDLIFESGDCVSLNKTSVRTLIKAYGADSREWTGKEVELYAGQVDFKDQKTDAVLVRPVSPPTSDGKLPPPKPKATNGGADYDDDVPI